MPAQGEAAGQPPTPPTPPSGGRPTRLGRYELITRIGQGGMAEVQLALQRGPAGFEKLVVVKLVHASLATQKAFVDMLLDEARVAALVKHPNVVDIYDLGQAEGRYFIAMEYLEGEPLLAVLRAGREGKRLDPLSTGRLIADTAEGLDAAHELRAMSGERLELVHHDISLGNIVVLYNGQVKLVDFGVAKATQSAQKNNKVQGKFSYMAPEKLRGSPGDRRSDLFSLGCVMWESLTLKRLFRGGNDSETMKQVLEMAIQPPSKVNPDVPPEYDPIVMRALDRDPDKRQVTAKELAVEIEELLRKRGYGAKNDKVAKYMQETFKAHIEARKKLVQEVVNKGSASAEVLDAAFSDPVMASGSPVTPTAGVEFSMKYKRVTPAAGVPALIIPPQAEASAATVVSPPPIPAGSAFDPGGTLTEVQALPSPPELGPAGSAGAAVADDDAPVVEVTHHGAAGFFADPKRKKQVAIAGAALLVVIVLAAVFSGGGSKPAARPDDGSAATATAETGSAVGSAVAAPEAAPADAAEAVAAAPADAAEAAIAAPADAAAEIEMEPPTGSAATHEHKQPDHEHKQPDHEHVVDNTAHHPPPPPPPKKDVKELVNQGVTQFVRGDSKGALATLAQARAVNPSYAPLWRVMGNIYMKNGEKGSAKNAFLRYLSIDPNASDAQNVRETIKKL